MPNFVEMGGNILAETGIAAAIINVARSLKVGVAAEGRIGRIKGCSVDAECSAAGIADGESGVRRPESFDAWLASPVATGVCSPPSARCPFPARAARGVTLALAKGARAWRPWAEEGTVRLFPKAEKGDSP